MIRKSRTFEKKSSMCVKLCYLRPKINYQTSLIWCITLAPGNWTALSPEASAYSSPFRPTVILSEEQKLEAGGGLVCRRERKEKQTVTHCGEGTEGKQAGFLCLRSSLCEWNWNIPTLAISGSSSIGGAGAGHFERSLLQCKIMIK